jgi:glycolate oxidase
MLKPSVVSDLRKIVSPANLFTAAVELVAYSYDATRTEALPWAVVRPATTDEIAAIMRLANRERFPVVPRGAGTGMSGGSVPVRGGVVEVEARGLFYPPDPASHQSCTIGGNAAECAGGLRAVKYGVTRDYVLGLEVVLPTGEVIRTGGRTVKNVAGYDLTRLIIGSEGTLGIVTQLILKLLPLPESVRTLSAFFATVADAAKAVAGITQRRIVPRALELVDREALRAVGTYLKEDTAKGAGAMLIVEVDGGAESTAREIEAAAAACREAGAARIETAETEEDRERLWRTRRSISPALYTIKPKKVNEDIVVPRSRVPDILAAIDGIAKRFGLLIVNFGHAGDGNIHTNIMIDDSEAQKAGEAVKEIFAAVIGMGGSISGEHGIGIAKAPYLPMEVGPAALEAMKKIKRALDPNNVLNPGKIFETDDHHGDAETRRKGA